MYRHQQYESRVVDYHEDAPFFREAVTLIDQCTKLLKDDRISLRNKIKDYLRALRENRVSDNQEELEHFKQIVQIFVEANKKKSLSKIQKGDRVMDWLQIKLRKFIDQNKKERHRKQLQNFRKGKFLDNKKHPQASKERAVPANNRFDNQQILGISRNTNQQNTPSYTRYLLQPSSLSRSRERSPIETSRKSSQSQSYAQYSYHKNFSFLKKGKDAIQGQKDSSQRLPQQTSFSRAKKLDKQIQRMNRSVDQLSKMNNFSIPSKAKNSSSKGTTLGKGLKGYQLKKTDEKLRNRIGYQRKEKMETKKQISQLTKLFSEQLNNGPTFSNKATEQSFMNPTFNFQVLPQEKISRHEGNTDRDQPNISQNLASWSAYEESTKKIQSMLEGSRQMFEQINRNSQFQVVPSTDKGQQIPTTFNAQKNSYEDIFTPPDFLAECRKLINSSNKKPAFEQSDWRDNLQSDVFNPTKLTFNNILGESREKKPDQVTRIGSFGISEVISENASVNISTKKPESEVQFQFKSISIHTIEELLLEIFSSGHAVSLDRYQIEEVMSKCDPEVQKLFQQYCDLLTQQQEGNSFSFKFVALLKFFYTYGKVFKETDNHFSNFLCSILDMRKNGFVDKEALEEFLESMEGSGIEAELLQDIRSLLSSVFQRCCDVEGGGVIVTRWSLFYLELKRDSQFQTLNELLSRFEFQIDSEQ